MSSARTARRVALALPAVTGALAPAGLDAAPAAVALPAPPAQVAWAGADLWVLLQGDPATVVRVPRATGRPAGGVVPLDGSLAVGRASFLPCCALPVPLAVAGGGVWTADPGRPGAPGRAVVRVRAAGGANEATRIPTEGTVRDVVAALGALWVLQAAVPGGSRVDTVDAGTGVVRPGAPFDPGSAVLGSPGPRGLVVSTRRTAWVQRASAAPTLVRLDLATGTLTTPGRPLPGRLVAQDDGAVWAKSPYGCDIARITPSGRVVARLRGWGRGRCALRALVPDGAGNLWAIRGDVPRGGRGEVVRIDGRTGRLMGAAVRVGGDPVAIAGRGREAWVADGAGRRLIRVRAGP